MAPFLRATKTGHPFGGVCLPREKYLVCRSRRLRLCRCFLSLCPEWYRGTGLLVLVALNREGKYLHLGVSDSYVVIINCKHGREITSSR